MFSFFKWLLSPWAIGIVSGLFYGFIGRLIMFDSAWSNILSPFLVITTFGFVFLLPFAMGYLTVIFKAQYLMGKAESESLALNDATEALQEGDGFASEAIPQKKTPLVHWSYAIFMPWIPSFLSLSAAAITGFEWVACVIMASPVFFFMASLGGAIARTASSKPGPHQRAILIGVILLPYGSSVLESRIPLPQEIQEVKNNIEIEASAQQVWDQIKSVPLIKEEEHSPRLLHTIGFPRPLAATLSEEKVGGVRKASFEDGVLFLETVTLWKPPEMIAFGIDAQPIKKTKKGFLNDTILGGKYFDVLDGKYRIESLGKKKVRLHLSSSHRVATHYNFYAKLWTRWVMSDLQGYILEIIKARAEKDEA